MSGLVLRSGDTPHELKLEMKPPVTLGIDTDPPVQVIETGPAWMRESRSTPSASVIPTTGIVTGGEPATLGFSCPPALL